MHELAALVRPALGAEEDPEEPVVPPVRLAFRLPRSPLLLLKLTEVPLLL